ncbi:Murein DD-endopeptidase MepM and murein hydrolase activator NlpD, contain LysM domain [Actinopolymorpha cephalotaxi]|uniref:Murein DD-endopeptidase MepM and murein hydrolase activator NlpD, contain LysM domain n=1 Tax=Actinopolymorpha cephalotaxi TaxID=504797 RepID=A0A1I2MTI6_9ACTN|nr:M23 family metallopeptidase [Actinopolymorpha cephalotaxi]NYH85874.1 murein DD-endopeptidase MepM/ murein hydrolase activator NlpD [Actinopolymorpha cephalotaxi]SFF93999.1 Murein DD-endopeptidase MepM and murein hydrolase activator NlpD, contain LysM domain [Actinopolymorpha cephalotaxi]
MPPKLPRRSSARHRSDGPSSLARPEDSRSPRRPLRVLAVVAGVLALTAGAVTPWILARQAGHLDDSAAKVAAYDSVSRQVDTARERAERERASRSQNRVAPPATPTATATPTPKATKKAKPTAKATPKATRKASPKPKPKPKATKKASPKPKVTRKTAAKKATRSSDGRPAFDLPAKCGTELRFTTYAGHAPDDMKIDFFNESGATDGMVVVASAAGTVVKLSEPGGVKIDHGDGWYTMSLHMQERDVSVGQKVRQGERIGLAGAVGTGVSHLHYEQIYDSNHDGWADSPGEIVHSRLQGVLYSVQPDGDEPVVASKNSC